MSDYDPQERKLMTPWFWPHVDFERLWAWIATTAVSVACAIALYAFYGAMLADGRVDSCYMELRRCNSGTSSPDKEEKTCVGLMGFRVSRSDTLMASFPDFESARAAAENAQCPMVWSKP